MQGPFVYFYEYGTAVLTFPDKQAPRTLYNVVTTRVRATEYTQLQAWSQAPGAC